ncbi:MAG: UDP-N-acetylglucosamine--N-acetylmuramyl-(pentapeptide) pyrophosphoryl-undecaprenol N-acetylglucosamine transferase, partial [Chitinispirillia bacterium]
YPHCYIFSTCDDMYPYYSIANIIICRSGAGTLSEIAYFGLPCIMIPLPWAAEDHQWKNAGVVESAGWGVRIAQDEKCSEKTVKSIQMILKDKNMYERMSRRALDNSPDDAAKIIVQKIMAERK